MADSTRPTVAVAAAYRRMADGQPEAWITVVPQTEALARARRLEGEGRRGRPLWGMPFAVKDNMDVAGMPTTVACPAFAYTAERTAPAVQRLLDAGAVLVGKTNLDQFATGLVGTRTPYGTCHSVLDPSLIAGGSSTGSAVVVAEGIVPFTLGTDTAGSGRVPAACNGIVGLKPTRGLVSTEGVVPACRSFDCLSIFARTVPDATLVLAVLTGAPTADGSASSTPRGATVAGAGVGQAVDAALPQGEADAGVLDVLEDVAIVGRRVDHLDAPAGGTFVIGEDGGNGPRRPWRPWRLGVPDRSVWGLSPGQEAAYEGVFAELAGWADVRTVDLTALLAAGELLYGGALVAERLTTIGPLLARDPEALDPHVRQVVSRGLDYGAVDVFADLHRLADLASQFAPVWSEIDALVCPTVPDIPTLAAVDADPLGSNAALGRWTNGVNLLDLCAVTVPAGRRPDGLPGSVTVLSPAHADHTAAAIAACIAACIPTPKARHD